jgi:hypothetical protein
MPRSHAIWAILLGLAALTWEAPVGLRNFAATSLPTRICYSLLTFGGVVLLLAGVALVMLPRLDASRLTLVAAIAAAGLAINQAVGLWSGFIICTSPG